MINWIKTNWYYIIIAILVIVLSAAIYNSCNKTVIVNNQRNDSLETVNKELSNKVTFLLAENDTLKKSILINEIGTTINHYYYINGKKVIEGQSYDEDYEQLLKILNNEK